MKYRLGKPRIEPVDSVHLASRLFRAGVDISSKLWLYQIRNLPHNFAEVVNWTPNIDALIKSLGEPVPSADGDRMKTIMAAFATSLQK